MTQQSSSILIFGTFIVMHSFAICSFRHWFWCGTLLALTPHIQNYMNLNRDSWGLVAHLLLSYTPNNNHKHSHSSLPISMLQTAHSPPHSIKLVSFIQQSHFSVKVSFINVSHMVFNGFFQGKIGNISHRGDFFMFIPHRKLDNFFYHTLSSSVLISHFVIGC